MTAISQLTNKKFGRLTAVEIVGRNKYQQCIWLCECKCGNSTKVVATVLNRGDTKSCGCLRVENSRKVNLRHGFSKSLVRGRNRFYEIYHGAKSRCENPKSSGYKKYGGKGIKVLWKSFEEFRDDMYKSYLDHVEKFGEKNTTIDRVDGNGNYSKQNCRWATWKEQARDAGKYPRIKD